MHNSFIHSLTAISSLTSTRFLNKGLNNRLLHTVIWSFFYSFGYLKKDDRHESVSVLHSFLQLDS